MCTALTLKTSNDHFLFGRNMDIEYNFNQSIIFMPRNLTVTNAESGKTNINKYAVLGVGTMFNGYPTFADVMNEKGLACAGLNFPKFAYFSREDISGKKNIPVYDFLLWIVSNHENVAQLKKALENVHLVDIPIAKNVPTAPLHFIAADKTGDCITIEQTINGFKVYTNAVGVLSNAPTFDWHVLNLAQYINLGFDNKGSTVIGEQEVVQHGLGTSLVGIPGDLTPASRFVRTAFLRDATNRNCEKVGVPNFYHILNNVAVVEGVEKTHENLNTFTLYTSCMNLNEKTYYYSTKDSVGISAVSMSGEDLDGTKIKFFSMNEEILVNLQN